MEAKLQNRKSAFNLLKRPTEKGRATATATINRQSGRRRGRKNAKIIIYQEISSEYTKTLLAAQQYASPGQKFVNSI